MQSRKPEGLSGQRGTIGYARVSTQEQGTEGVSLKAQCARIAAYCNAMDWLPREIITDAGQSAKTLRRPGMAKVLADVRRGSISRVVIFRLDRITRSTRDLADLIELFWSFNTSLVSVSESLDTETAAGRLVVNMLGVVAQWEREAIAERTAEALAHKRRNGLVYGRTPFGFRRIDDRLVRDEVQQHALRKARAMRSAGDSLRRIAAELEAMQVTSNNGAARWHPQTVKAILNSQMTLGAGEP
ncbi:MAG TPA: recombinase family protein [Candidatus Cybelea sp.]|nr:recombinase family protein [Candidatus Cybelea sp.]